MQVLDEGGADGAQRQRLGVRVAVGVPGVGEHVAERYAVAGHRGGLPGLMALILGRLLARCRRRIQVCSPGTRIA
jgi:hypothetical protein